MTYTYNDAIRMTGQLLLCHRTTGTFARNGRGYGVSWYANNATCWCVDGAFKACCDKLGVGDPKWQHIKDAMGLSDNDSLWSTWDDASDDMRREYALKLASVSAP